VKFYNWFQNLNEKKTKLFAFRGEFAIPDYKSIWKIKYEFHSGREFRFKFKIYHYPKIKFQIGFGFGTAYITLPFFKFNIKPESLESGFYFYKWAIVASWMVEEWGQPQIYFHIDDFFLGKQEVLEDKLATVEDVFFKMGDKEFVMNEIVWTRRRAFRRHIPYSLYHHEWVSVGMKIEKPPMHSGKGESGYDCDDDGSFGLYMSWPHKWEGHKNGAMQEASRRAVRHYVNEVYKTVRRYGGSSGERGVSIESTYKFLGVKPRVIVDQAVEVASPS
jgi:hypothetical protein